MRLRAEQLEGHLRGGLAPVYLIHGDEPLLAARAADLVRAHARGRGYDERRVFHAEPGFDWGALAEAAGALSLFGGRQLLDLRLPTGKPGEQGARALTAYAEAPPPDTLLLVTAPRLDRAAQRSAWYRALEAAGVVVQVWPVERARLPGWIRQEAARLGLRLDAEAARLLAERAEGNLLAAAQELEKIRLLHGEGAVDARAVLEAVSDSARYGPQDLADAALAGEAARVARILAGLRAEGEAPALVLWVLAREARTLAAMAAEGGRAPEALAAAHGVWERRRPLVAGALRRLGRAGARAALAQAARADRVVKGAERGEPWGELLELALLLARGRGALPSPRALTAGEA